MSDQYTPTTEEVRDFYALTACAPNKTYTEGAAEFDRWLATAKADAWDEAVEVLDQLHGDLPGLDHIVQDLGDINPYRKEQTDE